MHRDHQAIAAMIRIYCRGHHGARKTLCPECEALRAYAVARLRRCRFGEEKPVCGKCPVHCYKPAMRERIRDVMHYSGPRMLWRHPVLALRHIVEAKKPMPPIHSGGKGQPEGTGK